MSDQEFNGEPLHPFVEFDGFNITVFVLIQGTHQEYTGIFRVTRNSSFVHVGNNIIFTHNILRMRINENPSNR